MKRKKMKLNIFTAGVCAMFFAAVSSPNARAHDPNAPGHERDPGGTGGDHHSDHSDHHSDHSDHQSDRANHTHDPAVSSTEKEKSPEKSSVGPGGHDPDAPEHAHDPTASSAEKEKSADGGIVGLGGHDPDAPEHAHDPTAPSTGRDKHSEPSGFLGDSTSEPDIIEKLVTDFATNKVLETVAGKVVGGTIGIILDAIEPTMLGTNDTTKPQAPPAIVDQADKQRETQPRPR